MCHEMPVFEFIGSRGKTSLSRNRRLTCLAVAATTCVLASALAIAVSSAQLGVLGGVMFLVCLPELPYIVLETWNAVVGFCLRRTRHFSLAGLDNTGPLRVRTAIVMTVRNETVAPVFARFEAIKASVDATGYGAQFDYFLLSDSVLPEICRAEDEAVALWRGRIDDPGRVDLLRRASNAGHKNGNLQAFCAQRGKDFELMLVLDADSLMTGETIVALARLMQQDRSIGILQTLCVGTPNVIPFSRCYQFGLRLRLRCVATGAAWWRGDHGQFWGHNCIIRLAPFAAECDLQRLESAETRKGRLFHHYTHDQLEAALMSRAGFGVYLIPVESGSFEANPPSLREFLQRHGRWGRGNINNLRYFWLDGFSAVSRVNLLMQAAIHVGGAGMFTFGLLAMLAVTTRTEGPPGVSWIAASVYFAWLFMLLAPRALGIIDALLRCRAEFGGQARLLTGGLIALVFHVLLTPLAMFQASKTVVSSLLGKNGDWTTPRRERYKISWKDACLLFWPQTALGVAMVSALTMVAPAWLAWFSPFFVGLVLSIPLVMVGASRAVGLWLQQNGLCAMPEELNSRSDVAALLRTPVRASQTHMHGGIS
jgi:membrane glycosyltransferase